MNDLIDVDRYPIEAPHSDTCRRLIESCRQQLADKGALELPGFLRADVVDSLVRHCETVKLDGHRMRGMFPAYSDNLNDADNTDLPEDHPGRTRLPASHRFIPGDLIDDDNPLRQLYSYPPFVDFLKHAVGVTELYPIEDKLGQINMLAYEPGDCNGWHFDTNEFIVSLILQPAESGGEYHYIPGLRSADNENLAEVSSRMQNPDAPKGVEQIDLKAGSLFLFKGQYTLHRVTEVKGTRDRVVAILSYDTEPDHRLSDSSKLAMYGRVT